MLLAAWLYVDIVILFVPNSRNVVQILARERLAVKRNVLIKVIGFVYQDSYSQQLLSGSAGRED